MDIRCRIELLGELRVVQGDQAHSRFRTHKAAHLLAYLALHLHQTHAREQLLELFWPDMETKAARDNLSTALSQLRRQLEPTGIPARSILIADWQQVGLNPIAVSTDVGDFDALIRQARQSEDAAAKIDCLGQAIDLYRGDLLPACYDEWAAREQFRLQSQYLECLLQLTRLLEAGGKYADALDYARRVTAKDAYAEAGYQAQMRLLARLGRPALALQTYHAFESLLRRELQTPPSGATRQMAERIGQEPGAYAPAPPVHAQTPPVPQSAAGAYAPSLADAATGPVSAPPLSPCAPADGTTPAPARACAAHSAPTLPLQLTRFFGRAQERRQLIRLLQTPDIRLLTLLGPGGAGKTRLSIEVAGHVAPFFANRVWFVSLGDVPAASLIPSALRSALRLTSDAQTAPLDRVTAYLGEELKGAPCLLVLDNMEHLLEEPGWTGKRDNPGQSGSVGLIRLLLERVPNLTLLATSRQALRIGGEQEFALPPLALPPDASDASDADLQALLANDSVALYMDRARAVRPDFALGAHNAQAIAALCRRLEGMPLALEMAAAWIKTLPPHKMLERLEHQLDLLVSRRRDLPPRHQSLRATIAWSYDLLDPGLRQIFAQLAVFRGGWTTEDAEAVCGRDTLHALLALQECSLIVQIEARGTDGNMGDTTVRQGGGQEEEGQDDQEDGGEESGDGEENGGADGEVWARYRMLEPLREFALEKLAERNETELLARRHARHFLQAALDSQDAWSGPRQAEAFERLEREHDNLRAALDCFATDAQGGADGLRMIFSMQRFWRMRGWLTEAQQWHERALAHPGAQALTSDRANVINTLGMVFWMRGDYPSATDRFTSALDAYRALNDTLGMARALGNLGNLAEEHADNDRAQALQEQSLALYRQLENRDGMARCLFCLANIANNKGNFDLTWELQEQCAAIQRQQGDTNGLCNTLIGMAFTARYQGRLGVARSLLTEGLPLAWRLQDFQEYAFALEAAACIAFDESNYVLSARMFGAMQQARARHQMPLPPGNVPGVEGRINALRAALGEEVCAACLREGAAYTGKQAQDAALQI